MEYLYVLAFSNDQIKVGRSYDIDKRLLQHETNAACFGIRVIEKRTFPVKTGLGYQISEREGMLIERCAEAADQRFQREWFTGLNFNEVCQWAEEIAALELQRPCDFGSRLREARRLKCMTQAELGLGLGTDGTDCGKQVVYGWESGAHYPRVDQLALICQRLEISADHLLGLAA